MATFYLCNTCGNLAMMLNASGVNPVCCGKPMQKLVGKTSDVGKEKHVPVVTVKGNKISVKVGEVAHPMLPNHYIRFIILETVKGLYSIELKPGEEPAAEFTVATGEKPVAVYEYCTVHGLWVSKL